VIYVYQEQLEKIRAEMAAAEKQRKHQSKSCRQSSFTLPRLRPFSRKTQSVPVGCDDPQTAALPQTAAAVVVADDQKSQRQSVSQRASVRVIYCMHVLRRGEIFTSVLILRRFSSLVHLYLYSALPRSASNALLLPVRRR